MPQHEDVLVFGVDSVRYYPQMIKVKPYNYKLSSKSDNYHMKSLEAIQYTSDEKYPTSLLEYPTNANQADKIHSTQKPVALFEYLIKTYTLEGETVLDVCSGSGTTAIACLNLGRSFICGDSSEEYVELSRERIARHNPAEDTPLKSGGKQLSLLKLLGDSE